MKPYLDDGDLVFYLGDCVEVMRSLPDASVDAVCTDPPYGLEFMGKDWDRFRVDDRNVPGYNGRESGAQGGFNDAPTVAFTGPVRGTAFGGGKRARTYRCEGCGKRDQFKKPHACPPRTNWREEVIDPHAAPPTMLAFQEWCRQWALEAYRVLRPGGHLAAFGGTRTYHRLACSVEDAGFEVRDSLCWLYGSGFPKSLDVSKAIDKAAGHWRGQAGPVASTNGAMSGPNYERSDKGDPVTAAAAAWEGWGTALKPAYEPIVLARKPLVGTVAANVQAHGTGALNIDGCRIETDEVWEGRDLPNATDGVTWGGSLNSSSSSSSSSSSHPQGRWPANVVLDEAAAALLDEQSGIREAGASPAKRGLGSGRVYGDADRAGVEKPRDQLDGGGASRFFYTAKASRSERGDDNTHPTVKPVALMRWLIRLVTPPGGLVLDPFCGSGTTPLAARQEGYRCIAIDREADYLAIAARRTAQLSLLATGGTA